MCYLITWLCPYRTGNILAHSTIAKEFMKNLVECNTNPHFQHAEQASYKKKTSLSKRITAINEIQICLLINYFIYFYLFK